MHSGLVTINPMPNLEHDRSSVLTISSFGQWRRRPRALPVLPLACCMNNDDGSVASRTKTAAALPQPPLPLVAASSRVEVKGGGMLVENGLVYREYFLVRSFEIGPDCKITMAALMNHLQDTCLSHISRMGIRAQGFGSTPAMIRNHLGWVVASAQLVVDRYPAWGEVFQVDHWAYESGKNCLGHDWLIRDGKTCQVLVRASHVHVLMNKASRRVSKFLKEVRDEFAPHLLPVSSPIIAPRRDESRNIELVTIESADYIRNGLAPMWSDCDINDHVSNIKYIDWIIEGAPRSILVSRELCRVNLQYKRECRISDGSLGSLSKITGSTIRDDGVVELEHLLCLEDGSEIMRARTTWRFKPNFRRRSQDF